MFFITIALVFTICSIPIAVPIWVLVTVTAYPCGRGICVPIASFRILDIKTRLAP